MEKFTNEHIAPSSLPKFEEVDLLRLSSKYLMKLNIGTGIFMLVCFVALAMAYMVFLEFMERFLWIIVAILVLYFTLLFTTNYYLQKKTGYALRERDVIFSRGFIYEKTTVIPFNRIQHVSTHRGLLDKLMGLTTLKIYTAGGSGSDVAIPGLLPNTAKDLKEAFSTRISGHV